MRTPAVALLPLLLVLAPAPGWSRDACREPEKAVIHAEATCFDGGGMAIGFYGEEGVKVACLANKEIQAVCGPDGRLTRLQAYGAWYGKLKKFESECLGRGGVFSFQDPKFSEPTNESFCLQAQPEIGANMFEEPLCNYRSICPAITVVCDFDCRDSRRARQDGYYIPSETVDPAPTEAFLPSPPGLLVQ